MTAHTIDREEVVAYVDGELEPARLSVVQAHVNTCAECGALATELRQISARLATWQIADTPNRLATVKQALTASTNVKASGSWWMKRGMFRAPRWAIGVLAVLAAVVSTSVLFTRSMRLDKVPPTVMSLGVESAAPAAPLEAPMFRQGQGRGQGPGQGQGVGPGQGHRLQQGQGGGGGPVRQTIPVDQLTPDRMIVRTASMSLISDRFDQIRESLERLVASHQGRVTSLNATGDPSSRRSLHATIGVPAARMDALLAGLRGLGKVQEESLGSDDVTESFRDLGLRTANARREEQRLVELLSRRTGDLADVLAVERELARVRLEIERMEAETRATRQRVDLATVTLIVQEQYRADLALGPLPLPVRFKNALVDGLRQASESLVGAAIVVLQIAPTLIVWILILAWPARWFWRRVRA